MAKSSPSKGAFFLVYLASAAIIFILFIWLISPGILIPKNPVITPSPVSSPPITQSYIEKGCTLDGCNSEICKEDDGNPAYSTCVYKEIYKCYKSARCERQKDGKCGWTQSEELTNCIKNSPQEPTAVW